VGETFEKFCCPPLGFLFYNPLFLEGFPGTFPESRKSPVPTVIHRRPYRPLSIGSCTANFTYPPSLFPPVELPPSNFLLFPRKPTPQPKGMTSRALLPVGPRGAPFLRNSTHFSVGNSSVCPDTNSSAWKGKRCSVLSTIARPIDLSMPSRDDRLLFYSFA